MRQLQGFVLDDLEVVKLREFGARGRGVVKSVIPVDFEQNLSGRDLFLLRNLDASEEWTLQALVG